MQHTQDQSHAIQLMQAGLNIFLTGAAGTGKSECIKAFMAWAKTENKTVGLTGTTGISSMTIGGRTIHNWSGVGLGRDPFPLLLSKVQRSKKAVTRWRTTHTLIIDEISMLSLELFDKLFKIGQIVRKNPDKPFGGIQLIFVGDFFQLPAVKSKQFCFESLNWDACIDESIYLREVVRQADKEFIDLLNRIRVGKVIKKDFRVLIDRMKAKPLDSFIIPTKLYSTLASVDHINKTELDKLKKSGAECHVYELENSIQRKYGGYLPYAVEDTLLRTFECPAGETVELCVGAQVMLLYNLNLELGLVNGSRGVVIEFVSNPKYDTMLPKVRFINGTEMVIEPHKWVTELYDEGMSINNQQIPLKLAYAITIHKSQSQTLDCLEADLSNCFEFGQVYTCLSRVKSLDGLFIVGLNASKIKAHPKVIKFYENLEKEIVERKLALEREEQEIEKHLELQNAINEIEGYKGHNDIIQPVQPIQHTIPHLLTTDINKPNDPIVIKAIVQETPKAKPNAKPPAKKRTPRPKKNMMTEINDMIKHQTTPDENFDDVEMNDLNSFINEITFTKSNRRRR